MKKLVLIIGLICWGDYQAVCLEDSLSISKPDFLQLWEDCDACGCAAGSGSSGFESLLKPQFVGVKYFVQHYKAQENVFVNSLTQDQYFNTIQLWARVPVTERLSIYGNLPYHFHEKRSDFAQNNHSIEGIGDFSLVGIYQLFSSKNGLHQLNGGVGVKLPLGRFDEKGVMGVNPSFQLGTGSWDYQSVFNYKFQRNKMALVVNSDYTIKTANKKSYRFGNQWNYSATGFYRFVASDRFVLAGKLGIQGESYNDNMQYGERLPKTKGSAMYGKWGLETSYNKISVGAELMLPVRSNLASGSIMAKARMALFFNFGI